MWTSRFSIWAWAAKLASAAAIASTVSLMSDPPPNRNLLDFAAFQQRLGNGARVDILELTAKRHPARDAAHAHPAGAQHLGDVVRGRLALIGEIGSENDL